MCQRIFPITAWSRLGHPCDECRMVVTKGQLVYLTTTNQYCSALCAAMHTEQEFPPENCPGCGDATNNAEGGRCFACRMATL